jgi:hypothetical protein
MYQYVLYILFVLDLFTKIILCSTVRFASLYQEVQYILFVLDFLVHTVLLRGQSYLLGAECNETSSYLKGGFTGTVGSNKRRFLQGTLVPVSNS